MKNLSARLQWFGLVFCIRTFIFLGIVFSPSSVKAQYSGNGNHVITLDQAVNYIQNFKQNPAAPGVKGGYFERTIFDKILAQKGAVGIRYYYAIKDDGSPTLVLVGVDSTGSDMEQGVLGEWVYPCPPFCSPINQLNK
jgi:hypothetical protein